MRIFGPFDLDDIISPAYREEQRILHDAPRGYGGRGDKWADCVIDLIKWNDAESVLDFGSGQGKLGSAVRDRLEAQGKAPVYWWNFDPVKSAGQIAQGGPSGAYDLVICNDVLEHVEPEKIKRVLGLLYLLTGKELLTVISLVETAKTLTDGRQAHILLKPIPWWIEMMGAAGFIPGRPIASAKPEKQFCSTWRPA